MAEASRSTKKITGIGAGSVSGAGTGTALIALIQTLPEDNIYKNTLLYIAPVITTALTLIGIWFGELIFEKIEKRKTNQLIRESQDLLERAQALKRPEKTITELGEIFDSALIEASKKYKGKINPPKK